MHDFGEVEPCISLIIKRCLIICTCKGSGLILVEMQNKFFRVGHMTEYAFGTCMKTERETGRGLRGFCVKLAFRVTFPVLCFL